MDACTVTALDAITAFAVPNPNYPSQSESVFSGLGIGELPRRADHRAYFGLATYLLKPTLSAVDKQTNSTQGIDKM